jgi:hypothetical protein
MANRSCVRQPIEIRFNQYIGGRPYEGRTVDLSPSGLRAEWLEEPEGAEDEFAVELFLPNEEQTVWIWGNRIRRDAFEYAMRFVSMHARDRARL